MHHRELILKRVLRRRMHHQELFLKSFLKNYNENTKPEEQLYFAVETFPEWNYRTITEQFINHLRSLQAIVSLFHSDFRQVYSYL